MSEIEIPDEAIEALNAARFEGWPDSVSVEGQAVERHAARVELQAALPSLRARVLESVVETIAERSYEQSRRTGDPFSWDELEATTKYLKTECVREWLGLPSEGKVT